MVKKSWIDAWANVVVDYRKSIIVGTLVCLGLLVLPMKNLYFDNSNEMWFLEGDPALGQFEDLRSVFGNSQYLIVGIEAPENAPTIFQEETLRVVAKVTRFLQDHRHVTKVSSLTNYQYIHSEGDTLNTDDLIEDVDKRFNLPAREILKKTSARQPAKPTPADSTLSTSINFDGGGLSDNAFDDSLYLNVEDTEATDEVTPPRSFEEMEKIMRTETLVHDSLISRDMRHTIISARVKHVKGTVNHHIEVVHDLEAFLAQEGFLNADYKIHVTGNPIISERFQRYSIKDNTTTMPAMLIIILLFLLLSFRTIAGFVMPIIVIFGSIVAVVGALGLFGWPFNMLNAVLPLLLMSVGIGDSVHIIVEFYHYRNLGFESKESAKKSIRLLWIPCFNTSLTTAIGFLAISVSSPLPLKQYGVVAAVGVWVAFLISVTTLPALLSYVKGKPEKTKKLVEHGFVARMTQGITPFTYKNSKAISLIGLLIAAVSIFFSLKITVDANFVNYFRKSMPIRQDINYFDEKYNGFANLEFMLDSGKTGGVKDVEFLTKALSFQNYLESLPESGKANSVLNFIQKMNQAMHEDDPAYFKLPDSRELVAQYLLLYENSSPEEDLTDLKSADERLMRISLKLKNMSTSKMKVLVEKIEARMATEYKELNGIVTGDLILFNRMDTYIQEGLVKSFSLAIGLIVICFFVLLRSIKYGLLALIPSLFPIFFAGGVMYLMGLTLDFATMIVAAVTFGIAVDDTIHVMNRYIHGRNTGKSRQESIHGAMTESGRALIFTSLILCTGFSVMMLSTFMPNVYFGLFAAIIIMVALLADLILLPAVMFLTGDKPGRAGVQKQKAA